MIGVGDLVVCIDAKPKKGFILPLVPIDHLLREGQTYRVTAISHSTNRYDLFGNEELVFLAEGTLALAGIELPPPMKGFAAYRFRKVEDDELSEPAHQTEVEPVGA